MLVGCTGVQAKVIYSGGEDLDILPQHASKGKGLEFLLGEVSHTTDFCTAVAGLDVSIRHLH